MDLAGVGLWGESFSGWKEFRAVAGGEPARSATRFQSELIPARERRRAPQFVKLAIEVMDQACHMGGIDRSSVATVFASGMGDMQITDYTCRTLATMPRTISPTKFHNSVHNAATGYWSIATDSNAPANAVSGYDNSAGIALLEGVTQAAEENIPVLVAVQETKAPQPFKSVYGSDKPFAAALLITPTGMCVSRICELSVSLSRGRSADSSPEMPAAASLEGNFAADILGLLLVIAGVADYPIRIPLSDSASLSIEVDHAGQSQTDG